MSSDATDNTKRAELLPCPFCGHNAPEFERVGTPRQSCIVVCGDCGARHESSDEGVNCGASWNRRADTARQVEEATRLYMQALDEEVAGAIAAEREACIACARVYSDEAERAGKTGSPGWIVATAIAQDIEHAHLRSSPTIG